LQIVFQRPVRFDPKPIEVAVVGSGGLGRVDLPVGNGAQIRDERELMLAVVDLPSKKGGTSAVFLCFFQQFEGIV